MGRHPMPAPSLNPRVSRRDFLQSAVATALVSWQGDHVQALSPSPGLKPLAEVSYSQVTVTSSLHVAQLENTRSVLMGLSDDSLLKPFRQMAGQDAPGDNLGGWYEYKPDYDYKTGDAGIAPGANFGQWLSALARMSAASTDPVTKAALRDKVLRLNRLYAATISPAYYTLTRMAAYSFDKLVCGLKDAHALLDDPDAFAILDHTTDAATRVLPGHAVDREVPWLKGRDVSWNWDESPTLPENLYLAYAVGAGARYRSMAEQYLDDRTFFSPLAAGENVLGSHHGYCYVNTLGSAMQAYLVGGSEPHLQAAIHGFAMLEQQSFATGGWAPDETLVAPGSDKVYASLTATHNSFEAPCCSYAHLKLARYLLRATHHGHYGDSMERVMYNTVLGALPMQPDGRAFYYQDYNARARRAYSVHRWPCCSGSLPQVAADYGINSYFTQGAPVARGRQVTQAGEVWVNLYLPSILRWSEGGKQVALEQQHNYPWDEQVRLLISASSPAHFTLCLRVPDWADTASMRVNGHDYPVHAAGGFTRIARLWRSGDVVELILPMRLRLVPIPTPAHLAFDKDHLRTVALVRGPLVLFPLGTGPGGGDLHLLAEREALAARQTGAREWTAASIAGALRFVPFTEVGDQDYSTYIKLV